MVKTTDIILGIIAKDLKKSPSDALVIGVAQGTDGPVLLPNPLSAKSAESVAGSLKLLGISGAAVPDCPKRAPEFWSLQAWANWPTAATSAKRHCAGPQDPLFASLPDCRR